MRTDGLLYMTVEAVVLSLLLMEVFEERGVCLPLLCCVWLLLMLWTHTTSVIS